MIYEFGFGKEKQFVDIPDGIRVRELKANDDIEFKAIDADVVHALENPIASPRLKDIVKPGEKIAIVTSDITRPMPTYKVMPALLEELEAAGVNLDDVTLVFGLGSHRKQTAEEQKRLAGEVAYSKIKVVDSR